VLDALHEAADQIATLKSIERQRAEQAAAQGAAEAALGLAEQRFRAGISTYLTVLNAQTAVLNQRRLGADLGARALDTQIALIRALGGGYAAPVTPVGARRGAAKEADERR
jgi:outer membrane protein TolC